MSVLPFILAPDTADSRKGRLNLKISGTFSKDCDIPNWLDVRPVRFSGQGKFLRYDARAGFFLPEQEVILVIHRGSWNLRSQDRG